MAANSDAGSNAGTTDLAQIEGRMPDSVKASRFIDNFGRTFECPECGAASGGTCPECGYTHQQFREDSR